MGFAIMLGLYLIFGTYEIDRLTPPLTPAQIQAQHDEREQQRKQNCEQGKYENTIERVQNCQK